MKCHGWVMPRLWCSLLYGYLPQTFTRRHHQEAQCTYLRSRWSPTQRRHWRHARPYCCLGNCTSLSCTCHDDWLVHCVCWLGQRLYPDAVGSTYMGTTTKRLPKQSNRRKDLPPAQQVTLWWCLEPQALVQPHPFSSRRTWFLPVSTWPVCVLSIHHHAGVVCGWCWCRCTY